MTLVRFHRIESTSTWSGLTLKCARIDEMKIGFDRRRVFAHKQKIKYENGRKREQENSLLFTKTEIHSECNWMSTTRFLSLHLLRPMSAFILSRSETNRLLMWHDNVTAIFCSFTRYFTLFLTLNTFRSWLASLTKNGVVFILSAAYA